MSQLKWNNSCSWSILTLSKTVGLGYMFQTKLLLSTFGFFCVYLCYPDGLVPYDGVPIEEIETVAVPLTVIYTLLATAGIIFAIVCLVFNFVFRQRKLVQIELFTLLKWNPYSLFSTYVGRHHRVVKPGYSKTGLWSWPFSLWIYSTLNTFTKRDSKDCS